MNTSGLYHKPFRMTAPNQDNQLEGIPLLLAAAFMFSWMSVLVKSAGHDLPVEMLILARCAVTLVLSYAVIRRARLSPLGNDRRRLILRGLLGAGGLACFFFAITRLRLAEVTVIFSINPILTSAMAALLLGERWTKGLTVALILSVSGALLITRPPFLFDGGGALDPAGVIAAIVGAFFAAGAYVTVRRLTRTDHPHVIILFFPLVATPLVLPFAIHAWKWPSPTGWLLLLGIGIVTQIAQVFLTKGLRLVPAGRGTTVGYTQIAFAALWGWVFFDEALGATTISGGLLIAAAAVVLVVTRRDGVDRIR